MRIVAAQRITLAHHVKGGMEVQADTLYRGLAARGHSVAVITTAHPGGLASVEECQGRLAWHYLPGFDPRRYTGKWWRASHALLAELVERGRADVLLSQSAGALAYLPRARRELRLPAVLMIHASFRSGIANNWHAARSPRGVLRLAYVLAQAPMHLVLWRRAVAVADAIIALGDQVRRDAIAELGAPAERVTVVNNGVDLARFTPAAERRGSVRAALGLAPGQLVAVAATRLVPEKGVGVALVALARVPEVMLLVAGQGREAGALQRRARALGVAERVRFLGHLERERLAEVLAASDVFVMPTLCREGVPMSLIEAMASGLPVLASRRGGITSAITDGRDGLLVPAGDASALAAALARLAGDARLRETLGAAARATALDRFSETRMVAATEAVLESATRGTLGAG